MNDHGSIESNRRDSSGRKDITTSIDKVRDVLDQLRFGSITLTVHDARVVQIDVTERTRLVG